MEENNNNENQEQEVQKNRRKKLMKFVLKPLIKPLIVIGIGVFLILLTVGLFYAVRMESLNLFNNLITTFNEENPDKVTSSNNSSVIYIDEDTGYYKLKGDFSKAIIEQLDDHKVNTNVMGFVSENENGEEGSSGELTEETAKELQDMIDKYIKAEVQTTFPYTGNTWWWQNDDEIDGKIRIKRAIASENNNQTIELEYVKYSKFCEMVENNNTNVLEKFSLNPENFKLCIAKENSTTTYFKNGSELNTVGGGITKEELDYQTYLQNYSVPLNFFMTLHLISEDKAFMEEFVEMVTGGDDPEPIVLTYIETEQQSTTLYNYTGSAIKSVTFTDVNEDTVLDENSVRTIYTEEQVAGMGGTTEIDITNDNIHEFYSSASEYDKEITKSKSGKLYITKANTWIQKSEKQVSAMQTESNGGGTQENYPIPDLPKDLYNYTDWIKKDSESETITQIMNTKLTLNSLKEIITTSSLTRKYTVTDTNSEIAIQEFIDLIGAYPKVKNNIQTSPSNIFYLLQQNENTQRLEKIMRYVCYLLNDIDYGVTDINFLAVILTSSNAVGGNALENYIKAWENVQLWLYETGQSSIFPSNYLTEDGENYIVYEDGQGSGSNGHNNIAYGIATFITSSTNTTDTHDPYGQGYYNWKSKFASQGIDVTTLYEGALVNKQATLSVFSEILAGFKNSVEDYLETNIPEYEFTQQQKDSLTAVMYQYGNINGFADAYRAALNSDGTIDKEKLISNFVVNGMQPFLYTKTIGSRSYANLLLFTEGKYTDSAGNEIIVGATLTDWDGECYSNDNYTFPVYNQYDSKWSSYPFGGPNSNGSEGQKTISTSGCSCCALAMIISGYSGQAITPDIMTEKLDEIYPGGGYYSYGSGGNANVYSDAVLQAYGYSKKNISSRDEAIEALKSGYAVLGYEEGHYLAFVPVSSEDAAQGYVFRILDSARGHNVLCSDFSDADNVVRGSSGVLAIIYPH